MNFFRQEANQSDPPGLLSSNQKELKPYDLIETKNGWEFTTDKDALYEIYFGDGSEYFGNTRLSHLAVLFGFSRKRKAPKGINSEDERIKVTIKAALHDFFEANPSLMIVFNCSTEGGKQRGRNILFDDWFNEQELGFEKLDYQITAPSGQIVPTSVILQKNHSLINKLAPVFSSMLTAKRLG